MSFDLTPAQVAAGFALLGQRPVSGVFSTLPPVDADRAATLLADTGLTKGSKLTPEGTSIFQVLATPARKITSTVVPSGAKGAATTTFYAPREGGPYVALAKITPPLWGSQRPEAVGGGSHEQTTPPLRGSQPAEPVGGGSQQAASHLYAIAPLNTAAEAASIISAYLGLSATPEPLEGDAVELNAGAFAALAALADLDDDTPQPGAIRRALGRNAKPVVNAFRTIAPAGASDPGQSGIREAGNWLIGAGLVVRLHDNRLQPTAQGRAILRALRHFTAAGSVTVDHLTDAGPVRVASVSSIRTPERLLFGAWKVTEDGPMIVLGEPGSTAAATTIRSLIESPSVMPVAAGRPATAPPRPPPPPPPDPVAATNPQWVPGLMYGGLILAMAGAAFGLTGGEDASGLAVPASDTTTTTDVVSTTATPTTIATTTTTAATETTPATVPTTTSTSSTTTSSTTTTSTLPPPLLLDTFDGAMTLNPLFGPSSVEVEINDDAQLRMTALASGVIPATYPDPLSARVEINFDFFPQPVSPDGFSGVIVLADDPSDGAIDHYVLILTTQDNRNLTFLVWNGGWGAPAPTTIPESAGYAINQWNNMRLVINDGAVDAYINGVYVSSLSEPAPAATGYWGPTIIGSATPGETMLVDNVLVVGG